MKRNLTQLKTDWTVAELEIKYNTTNKTKVTIDNYETSFMVLSAMWDKSLISLQEQFGVLYLNRANEVIAFRLIGTGSGKCCTVDIKLIASLALRCMAHSVIIAHNHPSGNKRPSENDVSITYRISQALKLFDILLLDHIIITEKEYYSLKENGIM